MTDREMENQMAILETQALFKKMADSLLENGVGMTTVVSHFAESLRSGEATPDDFPAAYQITVRANPSTLEEMPGRGLAALFALQEIVRRDDLDEGIRSVVLIHWVGTAIEYMLGCPAPLRDSEEDDDGES